MRKSFFKIYFQFLVILCLVYPLFLSAKTSALKAFITIPFELMAPMKIEENGVLSGVHKDLLDAVAKKLKMKTKFVVVPFARSLVGLRTGVFDLTNGKFKTPEREVYLHYLEPPFETRIHMVIFVRKGDNKKISNFEALRNLNIATMNGRTYSPQFDSDSTLKKNVVSGVDQQFNMLIANHVDAAIMTDIEGYYSADKMGIRDKVEVAEFGYFNLSSAYFAVSKKSPLMSRIAEIQNIIFEMARSGETDRIYHNYFLSKNLPVPDYN